MWKLTADQKAEAVARYERGETCAAIGLTLDVSTVAINNLLRRRGVQIRDASACQRRLPLREDAFATITPASAYWAGFLMADGSICGREIAVSVSGKDVEHLAKFRSFMGSTHAVTKIHEHLFEGRKCKAAFRYSFKSEVVARDLLRYGVVPRKSKDAHCSEELAMNASFWRGVVDGDGTLDLPRIGERNNGPVVRLVGSKCLLEQFAEFAKSVSPLWRGTVRPHRTIWCIAISGNAAFPLVASLYEHAEVALDRKVNAAINILRAGTRPSIRVKTRSRESRRAA